MHTDADKKAYRREKVETTRGKQAAASAGRAGHEEQLERWGSLATARAWARQSKYDTIFCVRGSWRVHKKVYHVPCMHKPDNLKLNHQFRQRNERIP